MDESLGRAYGLLGFLHTMAGKTEMGIMEAEKAISTGLWSDGRWRRLRMERGVLKESKEEGRVIVKAS